MGPDQGHGRHQGHGFSHTEILGGDLPLIPRGWLIAAIGGSAVALTLLMVRDGLTIDPSSPGFAVLALVLGGLAVLRHATRAMATHMQVRAHDLAESALMLLSIIALGGVASYVAAIGTTGYYDAQLSRADDLLHFDWVAMYATVAAHPLLQRLGELAYASIYVSPLAVIGYLAWHGHRAHTRQFLVAAWVSIVLTLLLFPLFPARGALDFLWHGPVPYTPPEGFRQDVVIEALRDHALTSIDLAALRGVVCAPSFHTVCAVVFIATSWPLAALRRVMVPLNLAMLVATPVEGTHYLSDMLLGVAVAVVALIVARQVAAWHHPERALRRGFAMAGPEEVPAE